MSGSINAMTIIFLAEIEANRLGHRYLGTEHLLLTALGLAGFSDIRAEVLSRIDSLVGTGTPTTGKFQKLTPLAFEIFMKDFTSIFDLIEIIAEDTHCTGGIIVNQLLSEAEDSTD